MAGRVERGDEEGGRGADPAVEAARAKEERRRRELAVYNFCLQTMAWLLATFYATDYLPPLAIRLTVGLSAPRSAQYLVGYLTLGSICLLLGVGFGACYGPRIGRSRYRWRWLLFPVLVALVLIPRQGESELLSRLLEALCLLAGIFLGRPAAARVRRPRRPSGTGPGALS